jgi:uncharacterized protein (DUF305 family)
MSILMEPSGPVRRAASARMLSPARADRPVRVRIAVRARAAARARMATRLRATVRGTLAVGLVVLSLSGCGAGPAAAPPAPPAVAASAAVNDVDVMFLQMGLAQIAEGDKIAALASQRAANAEIRAIATELRGQWETESGTMQRWLLGWSEPVSADPSAGAHAGHGDLHSLRESDFADLRAAVPGADFDRTVVSLLLGNLHNGMETLRMEATSGSYPPAKDLASRMVTTRQAQIQHLLKLAA